MFTLTFQMHKLRRETCPGQQSVQVAKPGSQGPRSARCLECDPSQVAALSQAAK